MRYDDADEEQHELWRLQANARNRRKESEDFRQMMWIVVILAIIAVTGIGLALWTDALVR